MNVLLWIRGRGREFRPFVANRVWLIQSHTDPEQLQHIATKGNPTDLCSRGSGASQLCSSELWWQGPRYLQEKESRWTMRKIVKGKDTTRKDANGEMKTTLISFLQPTIISSESTWRLNPTRWSSWRKLSHVLS